ncbi:MAG TPA: response regulator [Lacipirellulaceae bacterium]|jgi:two-component system chemotaxis response regulator CheY
MSKRLLITDDAVIMRTIIADAAREAGWDVVGEAKNGAEAIEHYMWLRPDVVTLDLVMPEFDGMYALRGILEFDPDAIVLVVSALDQKSVLQNAFRHGATDFLVKPFDKPQLISALETHWNAKHAAVNPESICSHLP